MRRLWSYIILAFTALVAMGATFVSLATKVESNIEYSQGRELVFRVTDEDGGEIFATDTEVKEIAKKMIERLDAQDVTQYRVSTQGTDTITVELKQDTNTNYVNIETLLTFNGTLALTTKKDDARIGDEFLTGEDAYMETENNVPSINIPVGNKFSELLEIAKQYSSDGDTDAGESNNDASDDSAGTFSYYLYLWHDYDPDHDQFAKTISGSDEYDQHVAEKIFMRFDISAIEDDAETLKAYVNVSDVNGNSQYEASEVKAAYDTAKFYLNLLNSGELEHKVTFLYDNIIDAWTDELITLDNTVAWSHTLIATLVALIVVSLLLVILYRINAVAVITMTTASVFGSVGMVILSSAEFNAAALVGFIIVAIVSLASGVIYNTKFKEECYRGRSLKKANSEAGKRSLLPIVDIHVAVIAIGVFSYIFGGAILRGFAAITVLGGLISLILNTLGLRGMLWLPTNTTALQGKYEVFAVDSEKVPNLLKEEKQEYYGPYQDRDFTKKKKPIAIAGAVLLVAGIVGLSIGTVINKGSVFNNGTTTLNSQIYVETEQKETNITLDAIKDLLDNVYVYQGTDDSKAVPLNNYVTDIENDIDYKTRTDTDYEINEEITYTYYVIQLNNKFDMEKYNGYYMTDDATPVKVSSADFDTLEQLFEAKLDRYDDTATVSIKNNVIVSNIEPEFLPVFWGTLVGVAVAGLYLLLRYRLSRGIIALLAPLATSAAVAGVFAITTLPVTSYAAVSVPFIAIFTMIISIIFMNKEREMVLEDKARDRSIENRDAIMNKATSLAFYPMLVAALLTVYLGINFFGFGAQGNSWMFLILTVGAIVSLAAVTVLFGWFSQFFYRLFFGVDTSKITSKFVRKKKAKKQQAPKNKSAEPEEYTFIGIND